MDGGREGSRGWGLLECVESGKKTSLFLGRQKGLNSALALSQAARSALLVAAGLAAPVLAVTRAPVEVLLRVAVFAALASTGAGDADAVPRRSSHAADRRRFEVNMVLGWVGRAV